MIAPLHTKLQFTIASIKQIIYSSNLPSDQKKIFLKHKYHTCPHSSARIPAICIDESHTCTQGGKPDNDSKDSQRLAIIDSPASERGKSSSRSPKNKSQLVIFMDACWEGDVDKVEDKTEAHSHIRTRSRYFPIRPLSVDSRDDTIWIQPKPGQPIRVLTCNCHSACLMSYYGTLCGILSDRSPLARPPPIHLGILDSIALLKRGMCRSPAPSYPPCSTTLILIKALSNSILDLFSFV